MTSVCIWCHLALSNYATHNFFLLLITVVVDTTSVDDDDYDDVAGWFFECCFFINAESMLLCSMYGNLREVKQYRVN